MKQPSFKIQVGIAATVISILVGIIAIFSVVMSINKKLVLFEERQSVGTQTEIEIKKDIICIKEENKNDHDRFNKRLGRIAAAVAVHTGRMIE